MLVKLVRCPDGQTRARWHYKTTGRVPINKRGIACNRYIDVVEEITFDFDGTTDEIYYSRGDYRYICFDCLKALRYDLDHEEE